MKKVLIVENDTAFSSALEQKCIQAGYEVFTVHDGAEALHKPIDLNPDAILLNTILPTMSGYDLLQTWRQNPAIAHIPIIVLSHEAQASDAARVKALGAREFLMGAEANPEEAIAKVNDSLKEPAPHGTHHEAQLMGKKVVWVEDDLFLRDLIATKLMQEGAVSFYAKNGEECLEQLASPEVGVPHIIVVDLILPGMSGFDLLSRIRENEALKDVPIVVLSNLGQQEDIERTKQLGAKIHLVKAETDPDDIIKTIVSVLH